MQDQVAIKSSAVHKLMFIIPSLLGLLLFMIPLQDEGKPTVMVAMLAHNLKSGLGVYAELLVTFIIVMMGIISLFCFVVRPKWLIKSSFLSALLLPTWPWLVIRILGATFAYMTYSKLGPAMVWGSATGGLLLDLVVTLFCIFTFAGLFLPLLLNFGLLELIGMKCSALMHKLFKLPGCSAVGCFASWFGDGSVGVLITNQQYESKQYTAREAVVIGTSFSAVSLTFTLVILSQVQLESMFGVFYPTVCLVGLLAAIIVPKMPPLSWKKDVYIDGSEPSKASQTPKSHTWQEAFQAAVNKAAHAESLTALVREGCMNVVDMVCGVLPIVMAIGTLATLIAEYTPVFEWLGVPFIPYLEFLGIPEAAAASQTIVVGFADMLLPSILAAPIESDMTRFIIAGLSVTQLIYLSEIGALLLGSKIPVTLWELALIFLIRTLVCLPILSLIAHLIF